MQMDTKKVMQEMRNLQSSLASRPGVDEVEAARALLVNVMKQDEARLEAITKQCKIEDVPDDIFKVWQKMQKNMVYYQSRRETREAMILLDEENAHLVFDKLFERASDCFSRYMEEKPKYSSLVSRLVMCFKSIFQWFFGVLYLFHVKIWLFITTFPIENHHDPYLKQKLFDRFVKTYGEDNSILDSEVEMFNNSLTRPSRRNFDRADQLGFIFYLVGYIEQVLNRNSHTIYQLKHQILELQEKLKLVVSSFTKMVKQRRDEYKDLLTYVADSAYEVEYCIDAVLVGHIPVSCCKYYLVELNCTLLDSVKILKTKFGIEWLKLQIMPSLVDHWSVPLVSSEVVTQKAVLDVINEIKRDYPIMAFCTFHNTHDEENLKSAIIQLIKHACLETSDVNKKLSNVSLDDCLQLLHLLLNGKKYLVVLFDVPDSQVLYDVLRIFPDRSDAPQSKIVVVTPSLELAFLIQRHHFKDELLQALRHQLPALPSSTKTLRKLEVNEEVVGFKDEEDMMLDHLLGRTKHLHIISIYGMAGQGKTTLANKLYRNNEVVDYFHVCAWCCVSQVYTTRELILELLGHIVVDFSDSGHCKSDHYLAEMLYKNLCGRRYLIVMDDLWDTMAWDDLRRCFPDNNIGSCIIFTTRRKQLARQISLDSTLQSIGLLSEENSWDLLKKRLFSQKNFPLELELVGKKIAKSCNGLPLSIVLASGLLSKVDKKELAWEQIAEGLIPQILGDPEETCTRVLELSYKHLPDHLKPCFLYLGAFMEDRVISLNKIIRLWIAEGFINDTEEEPEKNSQLLSCSKYFQLPSLQNVAEGYMMELVDRSLVLIASEKSNGGVKACRVHDLIHSFCLMKAQEENFLLKVPLYTPHQDPLLLSGIDPRDLISSVATRFDSRRLCLHFNWNNFVMSNPAGPGVRSLLSVAGKDVYLSSLYDLSSISKSFKLLKILDLEDINIGNSWDGLEVLILLRYLAVRCDGSMIPSSISDLQNLIYLLVKAESSEVILVPDSFWEMKKLRHAHITNGAFDIEHYRLESSSILENLQNFASPSIAYGDGMEKILEKMPRIKKLDCRFMDSWDNIRNCNRFPLFESLCQLEIVKVTYIGEGNYPCEFSFPSNIKKLTLTNFQMPWNNISQLGKLYNLEVLKLCRAFQGEAWEMEEEEFPKLRFLKLDTLDLVTWSVSEGNFPRLERLVLHRCEQLNEIPSDIGEIPTLMKIEVLWCNSSAAISARKIQEEQSEYGNEMEVNIRPGCLNELPS